MDKSASTNEPTRPLLSVVIGAASASLTGMFISTVGPMLYFRLRKKNLIRLGQPVFVFKDIIKTITNGSSEFVGNVSSSIISVIFFSSYAVMKYFHIECIYNFYL